MTPPSTALVSRPAAYLWAAPNTLVGMLFGLLVLFLGGRVHLAGGVAEFHGGLFGRLVACLPRRCRFSAITFGHVILGVSSIELGAVRRHELVHVRQYERWGPFFLPAYVLSSLWQLIRGRRAYWDNRFEREAYAAEDEDWSDPDWL